MSAQCAASGVELLGLEQAIGCLKIYACERSEFFFRIAGEFLSSMNFLDMPRTASDDAATSFVKLINKESSEMSSSDLGQVDLIVTEIFDDGLLGEHCMPTLYDALVVKKWLRPGGRV